MQTNAVGVQPSIAAIVDLQLVLFLIGSAFLIV